MFILFFFLSWFMSKHLPPTCDQQSESKSMNQSNNHQTIMIISSDEEDACIFLISFFIKDLLCSHLFLGKSCVYLLRIPFFFFLSSTRSLNIFMLIRTKLECVTLAPSFNFCLLYPLSTS